MLENDLTSVGEIGFMEPHIRNTTEENVITGLRVVTTVHDFFARVCVNLRQAVEIGIGLTIGSDSFCSSLTPYGSTAIGEIISFVEKVKLHQSMP